MLKTCVHTYFHVGIMIIITRNYIYNRANIYIHDALCHAYYGPLFVHFNLSQFWQVCHTFQFKREGYTTKGSKHYTAPVAFICI